MNFSRRKFLQISAFLCTAPVINKIVGIASVNVDSCVNYIDYPSEYNGPTTIVQRGIRDSLTKMLEKNKNDLGFDGENVGKIPLDVFHKAYVKKIPIVVIRTINLKDIY